MSRILRQLQGRAFFEFNDLFNPAAGAPELVVTFLALLELVREHQVVVSVDLENGYSDEVRRGINGGGGATFTYDVELKMILAARGERTRAAAVVTDTGY